MNAKFENFLSTGWPGRMEKRSLHRGMCGPGSRVFIGELVFINSGNISLVNWDITKTSDCEGILPFSRR